MIDSTAHKLEHSAMVQRVGRVVRRLSAVFEVETAEGSVTARRAVSCLVEPEVGDKVIIVVPEVSARGDERGRRYILAVLEREEGAAVALACEGDLSIRAPHGRCTVAAGAGVDLLSQGAVTVTAGSFDLKSEHATAFIERLSVVGAAVEVQMAKVKVFGESIDTVAERVTQRVKRSYRWVEELDQLKTSTLDMAAKTLMRLHGKNTVVTSEDLVKVDGGQIHMG